MAESVRVITEEWNDIQTKIKGKVDDIEKTLDDKRIYRVWSTGTYDFFYG